MSEDENPTVAPAPATAPDTPSSAETTPAPDRAAPLPLSAVFGKVRALCIAFYDDIWAPAGTTPHSAPRRIFSLVWRIVEITIARTLSNRLPLQAAALTYYFLMALAPFVIFVLTIFAVVMNVRGEEAVETMKLRIAETIQLVAPDATEDFETAADIAETAESTDSAVPAESAVPAAAHHAEPETAAAAVAPELQAFANSLLESTLRNSSSAGTIGFLVLVAIAVFMIARVEDAYNLMWNVKQGRSWGMRFLVYFLFIVFGGAMIAVSASVLSVSDSFKRISDMTGTIPDWAAALPGGETFFALMTSSVPTLIAFVALTLAFACLNRYMPKTSVRLGPALIGGAFVSLVFIVNQKLTMIYLKKISEFNSIYGNLGVVFILMFLLYVGWIFVLLGGQLSYAVQNARFLKNQNREWPALSPRAKQEAFFACLCAIFEVCSRRAVGLTASRLSRELCIPVAHVVECLEVLKKEKLIVALDAAEHRGEICYNTAGTVGKMTLGELKKRFDNLRSPLALGGNAEVHAALTRFSAMFDVANDPVTLEELFQNAPEFAAADDNDEDDEKSPSAADSTPNA